MGCLASVWSVLSVELVSDWLAHPSLKFHRKHVVASVSWVLCVCLCLCGVRLYLCTYVNMRRYYTLALANDHHKKLVSAIKYYNLASAILQNNIGA